MAIRILITGGTFDKEYNEITGELYFKDTHMREILDLGRSKLDVSIRTLMMIDSLDMTESDRNMILENCVRTEGNQIIITPGTHTMTDTAKLLATGNLEKTIVLTGAMIPFKFGTSDGLFNLGSALGFVQSLPHGVYIAMNGRCFDYDKVKKNKETGVFEAL
jgi:L-asparaginase